MDGTERGSQSPLSAERLFAWHAAMFPTGRSGLVKITIGAWRTDSIGPMQVVSGPLGREKVHYQAPAEETIESEIASFLAWFDDKLLIDPVLKAGLAHLWFVTIHPFDDGNGRIARAITDMMLARSERSSQRFYSMSAQIQQERAEYYRMLEQTQNGDLNITNWLIWFLSCLSRAINGAAVQLASILHKAEFWNSLPANRFIQRTATGYPQ